MSKKSVVTEAQEIQLAMSMIQLGARLQLLESETTLSRERLIRLYKELRGESPPKGMLPFSTDWFLTWQPNIHSSLFLGIHKYMQEHAHVSGIEAVIKAYQLYRDQAELGQDGEPVLSLTRAWTLMRFLDSNILSTTPCKCCGGHFVVHAHDLHEQFVCGLCNMPSRAGKTKRAKAARALATQ